MTKKRLQKIYNCVMMHFNLYSTKCALEIEIPADSELLAMLKRERKTLYRDFEKWYKKRCFCWDSNRFLSNQEIYENYLEGTHCLYFHGDSSRIMRGLE